MDYNNRMTNGRMQNDRMVNDRMMNNRMPYSQDSMMSGNCRRCNDGCNKGNEPVDNMVAAMAYVPWQDWEEVYEMDRAFNCGTIFPSLNKPFTGRGGR